jgi:hypothetical protein
MKISVAKPSVIASSIVAAAYHCRILLEWIHRKVAKVAKEKAKEFWV